MAGGGRVTAAVYGFARDWEPTSSRTKLLLLKCGVEGRDVARPDDGVHRVYATGPGSALCDLCPALLSDGTLTTRWHVDDPGHATLQLKAATHGGAMLTGPHGAISGHAVVTCESGKFNAMFYGMSDGSLYRCRTTINGQRFSGIM